MFLSFSVKPSVSLLESLEFQTVRSLWKIKSKYINFFFMMGLLEEPFTVFRVPTAIFDSKRAIMSLKHRLRNG